MSVIGWVATALTVIAQAQGTPCTWGGDAPSGTDCSGVVSWVANAAVGWPIYGDRFSTREEGQELARRGFVEGVSPGDLNVGWDETHTALTMPDGTNIESCGVNGRGVTINGDRGAFQPRFKWHMYLPGSGVNV